VCGILEFWVGEDDGKLRVVMPLAENGDLGRHMAAQQAAGRWSTAAAVRFMVDIAQGLQHIHSLPVPVLHCDIKPANVLVSRAQVAQLADFGLASFQAPAGASGASSRGTPLFMAPEVLRRESATTASDVWSLGVLCFMLAAGAHDVAHWPFYRSGTEIKNPPDLSASIRTHAVAWSVLPADVPSELRDVIASMLALDAGARPSAQAIAARLKSILASMPGTPSATAPSEDAAVAPVDPHGSGGPAAGSSSASTGAATAAASAMRPSYSVGASPGDGGARASGSAGAAHALRASHALTMLTEALISGLVVSSPAVVEQWGRGRVGISPVCTPTDASSPVSIQPGATPSGPVPVLHAQPNRKHPVPAPRRRCL
jgi:eukaryotic-like serine/threonine-protein kinase